MLIAKIGTRFIIETNYGLFWWIQFDSLFNLDDKTQIIQNNHYSGDD